MSSSVPPASVPAVSVPPVSVPPVAVAGHGPDAPPILTITVDVPGRVLGVTGELDLNGQRALADAVSILTEVYAPADSVVDLSGVVFIDICGLNALEELRTSQREVGASLFLVGVPPSVIELYEVAGLQFEPTPSAATA
jgi:anti-anti-sigma factor